MYAFVKKHRWALIFLACCAAFMVYMLHAASVGAWPLEKAVANVRQAELERLALASFVTSLPKGVIVDAEDVFAANGWVTVISADVGGIRVKTTINWPTQRFEGLENENRPIFRKGDKVKMGWNGSKPVFGRIDKLAPSP